MRKRLKKSQRRTEILEKARHLIAARGLAQMEMEDIRLACNMSRGGLYHHFGNKRAILDALVEEEVIALADNLESANGMPIIALFEAGSGHLGNPPGLVAHLHLLEERQDYIASLELAFPALLAELLTAKLKEYVRPDVDPRHVAELFLTVNTHINRREILGEWSGDYAASFAATALQAMQVFLKDPTAFQPLIANLSEGKKNHELFAFYIAHICDFACRFRLHLLYSCGTVARECNWLAILADHGVGAIARGTFVECPKRPDCGFAGACSYNFVCTAHCLALCYRTAFSSSADAAHGAKRSYANQYLASSRHGRVQFDPRAIRGGTGLARGVAAQFEP